MLAGLLGALLTALITAYVNRRSKTGKIATSEAKDLWDTLRSELARLQTEAASFRSELAVARTEMAALREETTKLRLLTTELERQLDECHIRALELQTRLQPSAKSPRKRAGSE